MRKTKRARKNPRRAKRGRERRAQKAIEPLQMVLGMSPDEDCRCPTCAEAARQGLELTYLQPDGSYVKRVPRLPPMMTVRFVARGRLQDVMGAHERDVEVPEGCKVMDLAEHLRAKYMPRAMPLSVVPSITRSKPPGEDPVLVAGELVELHPAEGFDWKVINAA